MEPNFISAVSELMNIECVGEKTEQKKVLNIHEVLFGCLGPAGVSDHTNVYSIIELCFFLTIVKLIEILVSLL